MVVFATPVLIISRWQAKSLMVAYLLLDLSESPSWQSLYSERDVNVFIVSHASYPFSVIGP